MFKRLDAAAAELPEPDLLPCPFCGSDEVALAVLGFGKNEAPRIKHVVICDGCGAMVEGVAWQGDAEEGEPGFATAAEATAAWNLRGGKPGGRLDG